MSKRCSEDAGKQSHSPRVLYHWSNGVSNYCSSVPSRLERTLQVYPTCSVNTTVVVDGRRSRRSRTQLLVGLHRSDCSLLLCIFMCNFDDALLKLFHWYGWNVMTVNVMTNHGLLNEVRSEGSLDSCVHFSLPPSPSLFYNQCIWNFLVCGELQSAVTSEPAKYGLFFPWNSDSKQGVPDLQGKIRTIVYLFII